MFRNNYSNSKCPKCEKTFFEVVEDTPLNSNWKMFYVRCNSCKTVIGITEYFNLGSLIKKIMNKLGIND
jgi:hypothetical protein